jgi:hypothetical protein
MPNKTSKHPTILKWIKVDGEFSHKALSDLGEFYIQKNLNAIGGWHLKMRQANDASERWIHAHTLREIKGIAEMLAMGRPKGYETSRESKPEEHKITRSHLAIILGEMFSKSAKEHKSEIATLFDQVSEALEERGLSTPRLEYCGLHWEDGVTKKGSGSVLHFMTMPVLAKIHLSLGHEIFNETIINVLQPIILAWLATEPKKHVDLEANGRFLLRFKK